MADITGTSNVSLNQLMLADVQEYLAAKAVLLPTIWDLSSTVEAGAVSFDIPRISGGATGDWPTAGADAATGGVAIDVDKCLIDQYKQYSTFITDKQRKETAANLDDYFFGIAPSKLGNLIEKFIYAELKKASVATPDNIFQLTGAGNLVPTVSDIFTIAEKMDDLELSEERFVVMGNAAYYALVQEDAVINGSKSLSNDALINGAFSKIAGITLLHGSNIDAGEVVAYSKESIAFAFANGGAIESDTETREGTKFRDFRALKGVYGSKILDGGKRVILGNATGA